MVGHYAPYFDHFAQPRDGIYFQTRYKNVARMANNFANSSWLVISALFAASLVVFLFRGYQERRKAIQLRQQGFVSRLNIQNLGQLI